LSKLSLCIQASFQYLGSLLIEIFSDHCLVSINTIPNEAHAQDPMFNLLDKLISLNRSSDKRQTLRERSSSTIPIPKFVDSDEEQEFNSSLRPQHAPRQRFFPPSDDGEVVDIDVDASICSRVLSPMTLHSVPFDDHSRRSRFSPLPSSTAAQEVNTDSAIMSILWLINESATLISVLYDVAIILLSQHDLMFHSSDNFGHSSAMAYLTTLKKLSRCLVVNLMGNSQHCLQVS
jgi:hypothetical protein